MGDSSDIDTSERGTPTLAEEKRKTKERLAKLQEELDSFTPKQRVEARAKFEKFDTKNTFGQTDQPEGSTGAAKSPEKPLSLLKQRLQQSK